MTEVVIRYEPLFNLWYVCHEDNYQLALRAKANWFKTREEALKACEHRHMIVVKHDYDILQNDRSKNWRGLTSSSEE